MVPKFRGLGVIIGDLAPGAIKTMSNPSVCNWLTMCNCMIAGGWIKCKWVLMMRSRTQSLWCFLNQQISKIQLLEFPASSMFRTQHFHCQGTGFSPPWKLTSRKLCSVTPPPPKQNKTTLITCQGRVSFLEWKSLEILWNWASILQSYKREGILGH